MPSSASDCPSAVSQTLYVSWRVNSESCKTLQDFMDKSGIAKALQQRPDQMHLSIGTIPAASAIAVSEAKINEKAQASNLKIFQRMDGHNCLVVQVTCPNQSVRKTQLGVPPVSLPPGQVYSAHITLAVDVPHDLKLETLGLPGPSVFCFDVERTEQYVANAR